ncbi:MAG TPA: PQQ-binding-like beta-propeller repeat protein [Bryobacteraceae bacterium]|nr:PQQ-binding-like beta-propeller repeat protein [Bryobacteraceae bacterium]
MIRLLPLSLSYCIVGALLAQQAPESGEVLFFGKASCALCHEVNGRGGIVGPDLSNAGRLSADAIRQKIVDASTNPNFGATRRPKTIVARTKEGKEIRGIRRAEDTFSLHILDASGKLFRLDKRDLVSATIEQRSLMPGDFAQRLSEAEIESLVAYLRARTGRDLTKTIQAEIPGGLTYDRILNASAEPQNWLTYWGDYQGRHYSALKQIDTSNVGQLQVRWTIQLPGGDRLEATPIVVDGVMYTSGAPGQVFALDAKTGLTIWGYQRQPSAVHPKGEGNRVSRGVSVLGNRVFLGTLDAAIVALDARTGRLLWQTQVADTMLGYTITSPPLALRDKIITGVSGGERGANGLIDAYDPATGKRLWRFNTVPGPGDFGHETWKGESWKHGGGPTWLTGSYDPDSNTLYWTTGNPSNDADMRAGDNLFSCSVIALDANTGRRKWHYQFTPNDRSDWDSTQDVILLDRVFQGRHRRLLLHADRNGMFYVLDRTDGKLLLSKPFVRQTWNSGFDANGRPKIVPNYWQAGVRLFPESATNFKAPSYSPQTGWLYLVTHDSGTMRLESGTPAGRRIRIAETPPAAIKALDPETGDAKWQYPLLDDTVSGVLATAGGLVFGATPEGNVIALNARTGAPLWNFQTGGSPGGSGMRGSPMSYSVDGKQFIAISAGDVLYSFGLPD